jgi:hypothetical protein
MNRTAAWEKQEQKSLFDDQFSSQHSHLALEAIFAGFVRGKLQDHFLPLGQQSILIEIGKEYFLRAGGTFLTGEA